MNGALIEAREVTCRFRKVGPSALDGVTLSIRRGVMTGWAGASGAGKSTLARSLVGMRRPDSGQIIYRGNDLYSSPSAASRRALQLVPQDSLSSFNPFMTNLEIVREPLDIASTAPLAARSERCGHWMEQVRLPLNCLDRKAAELSGGQRRRLALARALIVEPELLILDETFSNLDAPVQSEIMDLIVELQSATGVTCIVIAHDLRIIRRLAVDVVIFDSGRIAERGPASTVLAQPGHESTRQLLRSMVTLPC